jgi:DNA-binding response OmpR family regulator
VLIMTSPRQAVVVEDDPDIRTLLVDLLEQSGFAVTSCPSGRDGLAAFADGDLAGRAGPDLVTLDLNLPDLDGVEVCRQIRQKSQAYIVILTARPDEVDRLVGLETGADDYLTKPFSPRELQARVAAMMRRPRNPPTELDPPGTVRLGALLMHADTRLISLDGRELPLTPTEFALMSAMLKGGRRAWTRDALLHTVWGGHMAGGPHLVEVHMGNLRRKLNDDPRNGRYIRTVRGLGYRLGSG